MTSGQYIYHSNLYPIKTNFQLLLRIFTFSHKNHMKSPTTHTQIGRKYIKRMKKNIFVRNVWGKSNTVYTHIEWNNCLTFNLNSKYTGIDYIWTTTIQLQVLNCFIVPVFVRKFHVGSMVKELEFEFFHVLTVCMCARVNECMFFRQFEQFIVETPLFSSAYKHVFPYKLRRL